MDPTTRGQTIKRARRRHGYSQSLLAGLVGRSESWLSQVERDEIVDLSTAVAVYRAFTLV